MIDGSFTIYTVENTLQVSERGFTHWIAVFVVQFDVEEVAVSQGCLRQETATCRVCFAAPMKSHKIDDMLNSQKEEPVR